MTQISLSTWPVMSHLCHNSYLSVAKGLCLRTLALLFFFRCQWPALFWLFLCSAVSINNVNVSLFISHYFYLSILQARGKSFAFGIFFVVGKSFNLLYLSSLRLSFFILFLLTTYTWIGKWEEKNFGERKIKLSHITRSKMLLIWTGKRKKKGRLKVTVVVAISFSFEVVCLWQSFLSNSQLIKSLITQNYLSFLVKCSEWFWIEKTWSIQR